MLQNSSRNLWEMKKEDGGKDPEYSSILIFLDGAMRVSGEGGEGEQFCGNEQKVTK
jgi:hypothetical protein